MSVPVVLGVGVMALSSFGTSVAIYMSPRIPESPIRKQLLKVRERFIPTDKDKKLTPPPPALTGPDGDTSIGDGEYFIRDKDGRFCTACFYCDGDNDLRIQCPEHGVTSDYERWEIKRVPETKAQYTIRPKGKSSYCGVGGNERISCVGKSSIDNSTKFTFHKNGDKWNIKGPDQKMCKPAYHSIKCASDVSDSEWEIRTTAGIDKISSRGVGGDGCTNWQWLDTPGNKCVWVKGVGHVKLRPSHPNLVNFGQVFDKSTHPGQWPG